MKCKSCGLDNDEGNKFCINCGELLNSLKQHKVSCSRKSLERPKAGSKDKRNRHKSNKKNSHKSSRKNSFGSKSFFTTGKKNYHTLKGKANGLKPIWITLGVIIFAIFMALSFDDMFHRYPENKNYSGSEVKSISPAIEAAVTEISSKFICSCLTKECAATSLEVCKCDIAQEERQFIRENLQENKKPAEIVIAVAKKYGVLKPKFASKYNVKPGEVYSSKLVKF